NANNIHFYKTPFMSSLRKILKTISTALLSLVFVIPAFGQTFTLSGKALDAQDKSPLIGAHIKVTPVGGGEDLSTVADIEGNFSIKGLKKGSYQLDVSYVGYENHSASVVIDASDKKLGTLLLKPK